MKEQFKPSSTPAGQYIYPVTQESNSKTKQQLKTEERWLRKTEYMQCI